MILTLLALVLIIIGVLLMNKGSDAKEYFGAGMCIFGCIIMLIYLMIIICEHTMATNRINKNKIQYESLQRRLEIIESDYEDVSKSDVIKDIAKWNQEAYNYKFWNDNLLTNWFCSDKVAESYKYIEY